MGQPARLKKSRPDFLSFDLHPLQWQLTKTRPLLFAIAANSDPTFVFCNSKDLFSLKFWQQFFSSFWQGRQTCLRSPRFLGVHFYQQLLLSIFFVLLISIEEPFQQFRPIKSLSTFRSKTKPCRVTPDSKLIRNSKANRS